MSDQLLDLKKSYGTITGDPVARYIQNGRRYDHRGVLIPEKVESAPLEPGTNPPEAPPPDEDHKAQMKRNKEAAMKAWAAKRKNRE